MEVAEERATFAVAFAQAEQFGIQRIRCLTCAACLVDGIGGPIQHGTMLTDEVLPRRVVPVRTGGGEGEIVEMKRREVALGAIRSRPFGKRMAEARLEYRCEPLGRDAPPLGVRLPVQSLNDFRPHHQVSIVATQPLLLLEVMT